MTGMGNKQVAFGVLLAHLLLLVLGLAYVGSEAWHYEQPGILLAEIMPDASRPVKKIGSLGPTRSVMAKNALQQSSSLETSNVSSKAIELNQEEQTNAPIAYSPSINEFNNHQPRPPYPIISRRLGEEGSVLLKACVEGNGLVGTVEVVNGSGYERLDTAALETVKQWKFDRTPRHASVGTRCYRIPIKFILES